MCYFLHFICLKLGSVQSRSFCNLQGEEYRLFWPDQQEFVRMAARFGATIVPFGTVGEDDIAEVRLSFSATSLIYFCCGSSVCSYILCFFSVLYPQYLFT